MGTRTGRKRQGVASHVQDAMEVTRFWKLVGAPDANGCKDWLGDTDGKPERGKHGGYGVYTWRGVRFPAHELAVTFTTGEIKADGLFACHSCDRPVCCSPAHLRFDTPQGNVDDMIKRGRNNPARKSTDALVELIRIRRFNGAPVKLLAKQYGFAPGWVSGVCTGQKFPDVPGPIVAKVGTGPKNAGGRRPPDDYIETVRERRAAGEAAEDIAKTIDHSADWVMRVSRGHLYPDAPGPIVKRAKKGQRPEIEEAA